jgi:hypothetical protein
MLAIYRLAAVMAACKTPEGMTAPAKLPDLSAERRLAAPRLATQAVLVEQAGLEVARPVPPLVALVVAPWMAATLATLAKQVGLVVARMEAAPSMAA